MEVGEGGGGTMGIGMGRGKGVTDKNRGQKETEERRDSVFGGFVFEDDRNTLHAKHLVQLFLMERTLR